MWQHGMHGVLACMGDLIAWLTAEHIRANRAQIISELEAASFSLHFLVVVPVFAFGGGWRRVCQGSLAGGSVVWLQSADSSSDWLALAGRAPATTGRSHSGNLGNETWLRVWCAELYWARSMWHWAAASFFIASVLWHARMCSGVAKSASAVHWSNVTWRRGLHTY